MEGIINSPQNTPVVPSLSNLDIVRAWKDASYRRSLSAEQLQMLPCNPAGTTELTNDELTVAGGLGNGVSFPLTTALGCTEYTFHSWKACGC